jgi:acyl-CoA hydrolase
MTRIASSAIDAVSDISSGESVWVHSMAATPVLLLEGLVERSSALEGVKLLQLHLEQAGMLAHPELARHIRSHCFFASSSTRALINQGLADYVPMMLSEIPRLLRHGEEHIDTVLLQVSPPDRHGICSLGVSVEATRAALEQASRVIAHINPNMPRTCGDAFVHMNQIDVAYEEARALPCHPPYVARAGSTAEKIGQYVAGLVNDGDCLQMGIGQIPDAVLSNLQGFKDLGVHTEMFSDGVVDLVERGIITNTRKHSHRGKLVAGFVMGSERLYDFVDNNAEVVLLDIEYVNSINTISKNDQVFSINSALQIDLSGQVCADSIGSSIYSGVGGQLDYVLGSSLSRGGRSVIALPSTADGGRISRIVPSLTAGAGVVTTRANVQYVVTEYGVANLRGKSLQQRMMALIEIAHPDFRENLCQQAWAAMSVV